MKEGFKNSVTVLGEDDYDFPERFSNEIYFTEDFVAETFQPTDYISNFSLKYIIDGSEKYVVNNELKNAKKGQTLLVNDKSEVQNIFSEGTAFSIFIKPNVVKDCLNNLLVDNSGLLDYPLNSPEDFGFYDNVLSIKYSSIEKLYNKVSLNRDVIIPTDFYYELAYELLTSQNLVYQEINRLDLLKLQTRKEIYKRLQIARNFLTSSLDSKFDLNELAHISCMSKFHLIRTFKQVYGITPHRFFIINRLNKAKLILEKNKDISITEISTLMGYPDIYSFSRQFKQIYGYSPSEVIRNSS